MRTCLSFLAFLVAVQPLQAQEVHKTRVGIIRRACGGFLIVNVTPGGNQLAPYAAPALPDPRLDQIMAQNAQILALLIRAPTAPPPPVYIPPGSPLPPGYTPAPPAGASPPGYTPPGGLPQGYSPAPLPGTYVPAPLPQGYTPAPLPGGYGPAPLPGGYNPNPVIINVPGGSLPGGYAPAPVPAPAPAPVPLPGGFNPSPIGATQASTPSVRPQRYTLSR